MAFVLARAVLASIAFQSADVLYAMEKDAGVTLTELRVDGGATANELLMQFQADLLGVPVVRARGPRDDRPRRRVSRRPRRRLLEGRRRDTRDLDGRPPLRACDVTRSRGGAPRRVGTGRRPREGLGVSSGVSPSGMPADPR